MSLIYWWSIPTRVSKINTCYFNKCVFSSIHCAQPLEKCSWGVLLSEFRDDHVLWHSMVSSCTNMFIGIIHPKVNYRNVIDIKRPEEHRFQMVPEVSIKQCWELCSSRPRCSSINYQRRFKLCELNDNTGLTSVPQELNDVDGCVFAKVEVSAECLVRIIIGNTVHMFLPNYQCNLVSEYYSDKR